MTTSLGEEENEECTAVKPRDTAAITSEFYDIFLSFFCIFLFVFLCVWEYNWLARYVNYDWEDARDRDLRDRDGRDGYFRTRYLMMIIMIILIIIIIIKIIKRMIFINIFFIGLVLLEQHLAETVGKLKIKWHWHWHFWSSVYIFTKISKCNGRYVYR